MFSYFSVCQVLLDCILDNVTVNVTLNPIIAPKNADWQAILILLNLNVELCLLGSSSNLISVLVSLAELHVVQPAPPCFSNLLEIRV